MRCYLLITCFLIFCTANAQTLGGNTVFNFLRFPAATQLAALGGVNVSDPSNDVGLAFNNPALLRPAMHTQLNTSFNSLYDGIAAYHLSFGYHQPVINTNFAFGLTYFNYGSLAQTDASGNEYGQFRPVDFVFQASASRVYLERWNYGATIKYISSNYGQYRSNGIAMDVGVLYRDSSNGLSVSVLAKNMGGQIKTYTDAGSDDLPFDLQAGITKRLANAPLSFSLTAHHLHQFDIQYGDNGFNDMNGFPNPSEKKFTADKLFRHFVFATTIFIGDKVELNAGYNYLRRKELSIGSAGNGLTGFSAGLALILKKIQVRYARSHYQNNTGYNQFGLNMTLNQYFGLGKVGEKIHW